MVSRAEHLAWCKKRALEWVNKNTKEAFTSMCSDLGKHPETAGHMGIELGMMMLLNGHLNDELEMRNWIEGFN